MATCTGRIEVRMLYLFNKNGSLSQTDYDNLSAANKNTIRGRLLQAVCDPDEHLLEFLSGWSSFQFDCTDHEPDVGAWTLLDGQVDLVNAERSTSGKADFELGTTLRKECRVFGDDHICLWGYPLEISGAAWEVSTTITVNGTTYKATASVGLDLVLQMPLSHFNITVP